MKKILFISCLSFTLALAMSCNQQPSNKKVQEDSVRSRPLPPHIRDSSAPTTANSYAPVDISPMDMSYYPKDYPILKIASDSDINADMRVIYSRPHLNGRRLFHDVVKYGEPWRLGANEATEIDFFHAVSIQGTRVKAGRYIIYCIPHEDNWTIVLNSNLDSWGLEQDRKLDVYKFKIPVVHNNPMVEYFTMVFEKKDGGANLVIAWDEVVARLPIDFK
jgi:hypothetical protein